MASSSVDYEHIDDDELDKPGYNVNLLKDCDVVKNKLLCPFCNLLMRNPVQTCRGELACIDCYKQAKRESNVCPIDGEPITADEFFNDKHKAKVILQLECFCGNNRYGCIWQGTVGEVEKHERECQSTPDNCYLCDEEINLKDICSHLETCLPKHGRCVYDRCGCKMMTTTTAELHHHLEKDVIQHAILNASALSTMRDHFNKQLESKAKTYLEREEGLVAQVNTLQDKVTILMNYMTHLEDTSTKSITHLQQRVNQLENNSLPAVVSSSSSPAVNPDISTSIKLMDKDISDLSLRQQLHENTTYDGRLLWKVDNVKTRLNQAIIGRVTALHSAPQFTERYGYKFCGRLYLNGDGVGRGSHISMFFVLMKSEFDNLLTWSFHKRITMRLINQVDAEEDIVHSFNSDINSSSFMCPKKDMNIASGCPLFVTRELFLNGGYIKDDTVFIELSVCNVISDSN